VEDGRVAASLLPERPRRDRTFHPEVRGNNVKPTRKTTDLVTGFAGCWVSVDMWRLVTAGWMARTEGSSMDGFRGTRARLSLPRNASLVVESSMRLSV